MVCFSRLMHVAVFQQSEVFSEWSPLGSKGGDGQDLRVATAERLRACFSPIELHCLRANRAVDSQPAASGSLWALAHPNTLNGLR